MSPCCKSYHSTVKDAGTMSMDDVDGRADKNRGRPRGSGPLPTLGQNEVRLLLGGAAVGRTAGVANGIVRGS